MPVWSGSTAGSSHQLGQAPIALAQHRLHRVELVAERITVTVTPLYGGDGVKTGGGLGQRGGDGCQFRYGKRWTVVGGTALAHVPSLVQPGPSLSTSTATVSAGARVPIGR